MPETENSQRSVLCVERNPDECELLRTWFKLEGFRVLTASLSQEALSILKQETVDICLLDKHLPEMDGVDLCKSIRAERHDVNIILTSTDTRPFTVNELLAAGANKVISKPIDLNLLASFIKELINKKTASDKDSTRR